MKILQVVTTVIILANVQRIGYGHTSNCGKRLVNHKGLITNGFSTKEGDWPWHAAIDHLIKHTFEYKCGGTVLNSKTILTAGHCIYEDHRPIITERVRVQLGLYNLRFPGTNTDQYQVFEIIPHPRFHTKTLDNDIAIIRLSTEATLNNYVQPICLWDSSKVALSEVEGKNGIVIGWGYTETDDVPVVLRQAYMPIVRSTACLNSNPEFYGPFVTDKTFCAGFRNGTSVCSGDSGGSMTFEVDGVYRIRGIVSLSQSRNDKPLCNSEEYVVFTDVAKYLTWIDELIIHVSTPSESGGNHHDSRINFQSGSMGHVMWSRKCEFSGGEIGSQKARVEDCGGICSNHETCTHFTWTSQEGGICLMQGEGVIPEAFERNDHEAHCGYVKQRGGHNGSKLKFQHGSMGRVMWSHNCDFSGGDIGNQKSRVEDCGGICSNHESCTHFTWTSQGGGICWMKEGVIPVAFEKNDSDAHCGYVINCS